MYGPFPLSRRRFVRAAMGLLGLATVVPLRRAFAGAPTPAPGDGGGHLVIVKVADKDRVWRAQAHVGDDPRTPAKVVRFTDADGNPHRGLEAWFYADCVEAGATRLDNAYDYINCKSVAVTYDGKNVPVPRSSKPDGTFDFWRGCRSPAIRYGKQVGWSKERIDWSLLPSYALNPQVPWDDSKMDYSFNGHGNCTTRTMGQGGSRPDIGYMPTWNMAFLCDPSDATWAVVRRTEDHIGGWGTVYFSDPDTGGIVDIHKYPGTTTLPQAQVHSYKNNALVPYAGSYDGDTLIPVKDGPYSWSTTKSPLIPDSDHLTGYALLAAMVTGTARDRDHASFWGNYPLICVGPQYTASGGVASGAQRRFAWCLRNLFMASYVSSDRKYFADETARNLPIAMANAKSPFGIYDVSATYPRNAKDAGGYRGMATWQQFYLMTTLDAVSYKNKEWAPFAQFLAKFIVTWYKYPFSLVQTVYFLMVFKPDGSRMTDFVEMTRMSLTQNLFSDKDANAVVTATTVKEAFTAVRRHFTQPDGTIKWDGKYANGVADYLGVVHADDAYPAMAGAATVCAANTGIAGTAEALAYWRALPTKPNFSHDGKLNFKPRKA